MERNGSMVLEMKATCVKNAVEMKNVSLRGEVNILEKGRGREKGGLFMA